MAWAYQAYGKILLRGCREMPEGKGVPSEIGSYGLSVHTQGAGRRQPAGPRGLGCKRTSNLAVVGSSLLSSPSSLPQLSPLHKTP